MDTLPKDSKVDQQLQTALESGDFQTALPLLPKDGPPITIGPEGFTPLHYACCHGDAGVTRLLITQYKYSIVPTSECDQTPAHLAAQYGHTDALKVLVEFSQIVEPTIEESDNQLVEASSDIYSGTLQSGSTQLQPQVIASQGQHDARSSFIMSCKYKNGETPLHVAARNGYLQLVQYLVDEVGCPTSPTDERGRSPLYLAAWSGQVEVVRYFTQEQACDPNTGTTKRWKTASFNIAPGRTPLHAASGAGHLHVTHFLVSVLKCDPSYLDCDGVTPVSLAAMFGHLPVVKFLVESGCHPMVREVDDRTPLHHASQNGHLDTVKYFASTNRVDLSSQDNNGDTPLLLAATKGHLPVVQFLVELRCDPMLRQVVGRTPLHYASQNGHLDVVMYLSSIDRVDLSCQDMGGITPLILTAGNGHLPVVQFLVERGCDPMVRDVDGRTPLHYASQNGHVNVVKYLSSIDKVELSCQDESGITPVQLAGEHSQWDIVLYFCRMGEPIGWDLTHILGMPEPLALLARVYVVGNRSSGKSSLVQALSTERGRFGNFLKVRGVIPDTSGILPSEFDSKKYGKVTFYDFAGHPEYYSGHEAVLENASHPVVVMVVDLSKDHQAISRALRYWRQLLHSSLSAGSHAHVIVVGSHSDVVPSRDLSTKAALLEQFTSSRVLSVVGKCVLDC